MVGHSRAVRTTCFMLLLVVASSWASNARGPDGDRKRAALLLPSRGLTVSQAAPPRSATSVLLKADSNLPIGYNDEWRAGDQTGTVLQASTLSYPLTVASVEAMLYTFPGASSQVTLRARVYAIENGAPGALLTSSEIVTRTLGVGPWMGWLTFDLPGDGLLLGDPQPFLAVIEYVSGVEGQTPSVVFDAAVDVDHGVCFRRRAGEPWREHYDAWQEAAYVGYSMIRARAEVSNGPADTSVLEPSADAILASGQPMGGEGLDPGGLPYLLVGHYGAGWDNLRSMLWFPDPVPPIEGATPIEATLSLYHNSALSQTVPLSISVHRVTEAWDEATVGWYTHSTSYEGDYGAMNVLPLDESKPFRDQLISVDVTALLLEWADGTHPNFGIMLTGGEDEEGSCKWVRSVDVPEEETRPKLIVKWLLPGATPTPTPTSPSGSLYLPIIQKT